MYRSFRTYRIFFISLTATLVIVAIKYLFHRLGWELVAQTGLHNSVVAGVTFVLSFLMSAAIIDYKESERIPADFAANVEDMYNDAAAIHASYPVFDLTRFRRQLRKVAIGFGQDVRHRSYNARNDINQLNQFFTAMEAGKVPPNFIVKLKQQQTQLLRVRHRVDYIQRIKFIPSATILARSIVTMVIVLLVLTEIEPFYGGLSIVGLIAFIQIYMLILIKVIGKPFHHEGATQDDVSLFLISSVVSYLSRKPKDEPGNA